MSNIFIMKTEVYDRRHLEYPKGISNKYFVFRKSTRFISYVYDTCGLLIISKINEQFLTFFENLELRTKSLTVCVLDIVFYIIIFIYPTLLECKK